MSTGISSTIPNTVPTGGNSNGGNTTNGNNGRNGNNNNGNRNGRGGRGPGGNNSNNGIAGTNGNTIPKEFKNDSTDLGVMYQKYFDCNTQQDKVRFVMTQEDMALYVAQQYKQFGNEFKALVLDPSKTLPTLPRPSMPLIRDPKYPNDPTKMIQKKLDDCDDMEKIIYTETAKDYVKRLKALEADLQALYNFILGRCTERLRDRLKTHERYDSVDAGSDPAGLLLMIREISHQVESNVKLARTIDDHIANMYRTKQGPNVTIAQYHTQFKSAVAALQTMGGGIWQHSGMRKDAIARLQETGKIDKNRRV
mmetsp:Transcript_4175/g.10353  ORF Transcript_4175/g.10353 Transcript_4175/m.10353 type:complete len:309 (-) Transcript_4175:562-1488(-)